MNPNEQTPQASGGLEQISLAGFLFALFKRDATGELHLRYDGSQTDIVFVRDGFPVHVKNDRPTVDVLGAILVELGLIDSNTRNRSLELLARGGAKHGEILVDMGALAPDRLVQALALQLRRKLNRLFYIQTGKVDWFARDHERSSEVHAHPFQVIMQGVRSAFGPERLGVVDERFRGKALRLLGGFAPYEPLYEFEEEETALVQALSAEFLTLDDLVARGGLGELRTRALVHVLDLTEVLDARDAATVPRPTPKPIVPPPAPAPAPAPAPTPRPVVPGSGPVAVRSPSRPPGATQSGAAPLTPRPVSPLPVTPLPVSAHGAALDSVRERILLKHASLVGASHFDILEVDKDATIAQVQEAYRARAKVFHPDRLPRDIVGEMNDKVDEVFQRINEAYRVLADDKERSAYRALLESGGPTQKMDASNILRAERAFHRGEVALKRGAFAQAEKEFGEAAQLNTLEGEYQAAQAWARWRAAALSDSAVPLRKEALTIVQRVIQDRATSERLEFWLAELLEADGKVQAALIHYRKVVDLNHHHVDAKRKIHMHTRKRSGWFSETDDDKKKGGGGLFGGLFKKK